MVITGTQGELVVVDIFGTHAPLNLLQLLLETTRSIAKALEDTGDRTYVVILFDDATLVILGRFTFVLLGNGGHQQLIGIGSNGEAVVFVDRNHERSTDAQVGRQEVGTVVAKILNLTTHVRNVHTQTELTLTTSDVDVVVIIAGQVGSKGRCRRGILGIVVAQVAIQPTDDSCNGELLTQHQRGTYIERHLVRLDRHGIGIVGSHHLTQREIAQRTTDGCIVANTIIACHIGQVDVIHQLAQPRGVVQGNTRTTDAERILGRIPILRVHIRIGSHTDITHTCRTGIGGNGL